MIIIMGENEEEKKLNIENQSSTKEENNEIKELETKKELVESKPISEKKEEANFKKVETKTKKKKHSLLKAILILIGLLIVIYFIFVMRNLYILNDIYQKASIYTDITNYTYRARAKLGEYTATRKDNIIRIEQKSLDAEDVEVIMWDDLENNEGIISYPSQKTAIRREADEIIDAIPFAYSNENEQIVGTALYTLIYSDEYDGKNCYVICISSDYKKWVEKDTGLVLKIESGGSTSLEILSVETNNVDEIYKPDLTGYQITDETTNTVVGD